MSSMILNPFAGQEKSLQYTYAHTLMYSVFVIPRKHVLIIQLLHMYSRITLRQRCLVKSGKNDENYQSVIKTLVKIVSLTGEKVRLSIAVSLYTTPVQ